MAIDLSKLSPEAQAGYRKTGQRYDSGRTLKQAEKSRNGANKLIELHPEECKRVGLRAGLVTRLEDARDLLLEHTSGRAVARTVKKTTNVAHMNAIDAAKTTRLGLHSTYNIARTQLFETGDKASVDEIDAALNATRSAGDDSDELIRQLNVLAKPLTNAAIRQAVADGDETVPASLETEVAARVATLGTTRQDKAGPSGTPVDTGVVDVIDGMLIAICRDIRRAGRALARAVGKPELGDEVELDLLYEGSSRGKSGGGGGGPAAG